MSKYDDSSRIKAKRKRVDTIYELSTVIASLVGIVSLIAIVSFVLIKGASLVSWGLITGDYYASSYHLTQEIESDTIYERNESLDETIFYSSKWGIGLQDSEDREGHSIVTLAYIQEDSPFYLLVDRYPIEGETTNINIKEGLKINNINFGTSIFIDSKGAELMSEALDDNEHILEIYLSGEGGGIRGSLISTLYLVFFSLLFAVPIGISTAIYLNEYAKRNWITNQLRRFIEMLTGVPSIIFGMVGLVVFIPLTSIFGLDGRNLIAASLTLSIIILPTIIRSTEESLKVIPLDLRQASLAIGANKTQTTFKVVLPNALPGILTGILLGIGRIIGESAALIFVLGTTISDTVSLGNASTSLAVQIWSVMGGEVANFELASAIAIIILIVVLVLNITVKYISYRLNKAWH